MELPSSTPKTEAKPEAKAEAKPGGGSDAKADGKADGKSDGKSDAKSDGKGPPTVDEARAFLAQVDKDVRALWVARDTAGWVNQNFITDDTEKLAANAEEATAEYFTRTIKAATRFDGLACGST